MADKEYRLMAKLACGDVTKHWYDACDADEAVEHAIRFVKERKLEIVGLCRRTPGRRRGPDTFKPIKVPT